MPAGRPKELTDLVRDDARAYLQECKDAWVFERDMIVYEDGVKVEADDEEDPTDEEVRTGSRARKRRMYGRSKYKVELPSIAGLAVYLHCSRQTIYNWAEADSEFLDIIEELLAEQEKRLVNSGLSGEYSGTIAKLILTKHGYSDKTDVTSGGAPIQASPEAQAMAAAAIDSFLNGTSKPTAATGE